MSWLFVQNDYKFDHVYIISGGTDIRFIKENELEASPNLLWLFCLDRIKTMITNSQLQIQLHNGLIYTEQGWVNYNYPWDSTRVSSIASVLNMCLHSFVLALSNFDVPIRWFIVLDMQTRSLEKLMILFLFKN